MFFHSSGVFPFHLHIFLYTTLFYSSKTDNKTSFPHRSALRSYSARSRFHSPSFCAPSAHSHYLPHSPRSYLEPDRTSERPSHTCRYRRHFVCFRARPAQRERIILEPTARVLKSRIIIYATPIIILIPSFISRIHF